MYACNFIKKRFWDIFFPTSFAKYLGRVFLYIIATVSDFSCSSNRVTFSKPSQTSMMKLFCWNRWPMCKIPKLHQIPWCINLRVVSAEFQTIRTKLCANCAFPQTVRFHKLRFHKLSTPRNQIKLQHLREKSWWW